MSQRMILFLGSDDRAAQASAAFAALVKRMGLPWSATSALTSGAPAMDGVSWIVAVTEASDAPGLRERFPAVSERIEFWHLVAGPSFVSDLDREVNDLFARLLGGGRPRTLGPLAPLEPPKPPPKPEHPKKSGAVKVGRETAGRKGKGVTVVFDLPLDEDGMKELATTLKQKCGTGGTVKDGRIEIQGDHRDRIVAELEKLGYKAKRAGG